MCAKRHLTAMRNFVSLIIFIGFLVPAVQAQEVYFSISGQTVTVESGDRTGQYDYWFRPKPGVDSPRPATVEIFDAGLGGFADVISGQPSTRTTFALYPFNEMYELGRRSIEPRSGSPTLIESTTTFTEDRFLNRWIPFFPIAADTANGYIMRVSTDRGNDVNDFRIRISGEGASDWELITLNLSVGLYLSSPENKFQFRPLWPDTAPPTFTLSGEEDSRVYLMDTFGHTNEVFENWDDYESTRYGKDNIWAVEMTGSAIRINNRVLKGVDQIVPFRFDPVILNEVSPGTPTVRQVPGPECKVYGLEASFRGFSLDVAQAEWSIDNTQFSGASFQHTFPDFGEFAYRGLIPTRGRHVPRFVVAQGNVLVNAPPFAQVNNYRPTISPGERITLDASMSYDPEGRDLQYQWFVNDDFRGSSPQFTFASTVSGRYDVRLVLNDTQPDASCTETIEYLPIVVNTQPYAEIAFEPVIARGVEATISVTNDLDADGDDVRFTWQGAGLVGEGRGRDVVVSHEEPGRYGISLTADDQTGTANARYSTEVTYKVNAAPVPQFALPTFLAPGQGLRLDASASSDPDGDQLTYSWKISDGRTLSGVQNEITFDEPGLYAITLTVDDGEGVENSSQELVREVRVNDAPVPVISATDFTNNPIVRFDAAQSSDSDQEIVSYEWDFGDGNTGRGAQITHTYAEHGSYTVRLTVDDGTEVPNSRQSVTHDVRVNKNPVALIDRPGVVAPGEAFIVGGGRSFDPDGTQLTYRWTRNGEVIGEEETLRYQIETPGLHQINLTVRDSSPFEDASGNASVTVRVNHAPVVEWNNNPVVTAPAQRTEFSASGSYDSDNENLAFTWEFEDGTTLEGESVNRTFENPGIYYFTVSADDGKGLSNSITTLEGYIRVNQSPIIVTETQVRSNNTQVYLDASESYDPDGENLLFTWVLPDGSTRSEAAFTWTAPEPGIHAISLRVDDGEGLSNSVTTERLEVLLNRPPVAVVDSGVESCTDQVIIFSSARSFDPDGDSFQTMWDFGDGNTSLEANPVHSYSNPGTYTARIKLDDGFSETPTVQEIPVIIEGSPQARIQSREFTVCANSPVVFDGSDSSDPNGMIGSFSWDFGDMNTAVGEKTTHLFTRPGTYRVTLTITVSGTGNCPNISQATAMVTVVAAPRARFEVPSVVSPGTAISLDASDSETADTITEVLWSIRKNGESYAEMSGMQQSFTPDSPGRYEVELTINTNNDAGCSRNTETRVIHVNASPEVVWNLPAQWPQFTPFRLSADGSQDSDGYIDTYLWMFNGEEIGRGLTASMPVLSNGNHTVELIVRDNSGVENSEVRLAGDVFVNPAPSPSFALPGTVFSGETIRLRADDISDLAGNNLASSWTVNGAVVAGRSGSVSPETDGSSAERSLSENMSLAENGRTLAFTARSARYEIVLTQDDGLGLTNSVKSVSQIVLVRQPEVVRPALPAAIIEGERLRASDLRLPDGYVIVESGEWGADVMLTEGQDLVGGISDADGLEAAAFWSARDARLFVGWQPRGEGEAILSVYGFEIPVYEPLRADESELSFEVAWNPVNSSVLVRAPGVNRSGADVVRHGWRAVGGEVVAEGAEVRLDVTRGRNEFELVITDDRRIRGGSEITILVVITVD